MCMSCWFTTTICLKAGFRPQPKVSCLHSKTRPTIHAVHATFTVRSAITLRLTAPHAMETETKALFLCADALLPNSIWTISQTMNVCVKKNLISPTLNIIFVIE